MNNLYKKIPAFTLLELLVTLSLTTLIVTMSYFSYNYLLSGFYKYGDINDKINQHCRLRTELDNLMYRADALQRKGNSLLFMMPKNKAIKMDVNENAVVLQDDNHNNLDTLKLQIKSVQYYWNSDSIVPDGAPVQKIKLSILFSNQAHTLIFEKPYDADKLIQLDSLYKSIKGEQN